jgi:hypothetical protein
MKDSTAANKSLERIAKKTGARSTRVRHGQEIRCLGTCGTRQEK